MRRAYVVKRKRWRRIDIKEEEDVDVKEEDVDIKEEDVDIKEEDVDIKEEVSLEDTL